MILAADLNFALPLSNPVLIFSLVLFIILFAPIVLDRLKIPPIIGLILAGVAIGPYGFHIMNRDSSIVLFGTVGLLYIMFLAGLEIDISDFKKNRNNSLIFGLYTFSIPMVLGTIVSYYLLKYSLTTSILLASMFASHTLVAYPIVSRYGISKNKVVNITVGGTMITDTLALLVLAIIAGMAKGEIDERFWIRLGISIAIFAIVVWFGFPYIARWFFKKFEDNISQFIFVLALVFLAAFLAEAAGVEAIIGAFLAGLTLNRLIPKTSPLMNRVEFVGNALFIPFFLIGVGMLVNMRVLFQGPNALIVAATMTAVATFSKYMAAYLSQKTFGLSNTQRTLMFGLSNAQAAATLAAVLVGYNIIVGKAPDGSEIRLLNSDVLNGTILMILVTCTISSFAAEKASKKLAETEEGNVTEEAEIPHNRILIPISNPETINSLVELALLIKNPKSKEPLYALNVIDGQENELEKVSAGKKLLTQATKIASAADVPVEMLTRYDLNITSGIIHTIKEEHITDIVIGLHQKSNFADSFFGAKTEGLLKGTNKMILISKSVQPIGTYKRMIVAVPANAEKETGFLRWYDRLKNISKETGSEIIFFANKFTIEKLQWLNSRDKTALEVQYKDFSNWEDFLILSREVGQNDLFVIVISRKTSISYSPIFEKIPGYLNKYFHDNSFILLFPQQFESDPAYGIAAMSNQNSESF